MIGWVITLCMSVFGSYQMINARVYEVESKIKLLELQQLANQNRLEKLEILYPEIRESLYRIESSLQQKQDKKYLQ